MPNFYYFLNVFLKWFKTKLAKHNYHFEFFSKHRPPPRPRRRHPSDSFSSVSPSFFQQKNRNFKFTKKKALKK